MKSPIIVNFRLPSINFSGLGESINDGGRRFKSWFTDFTLVYSPIFIVAGLILTGIDLFLNLGIGNGLWFKLPWSIAQLFAVDGLWFAVWNRILTDEYRWKLIAYHALIIFLGLCLTGIAIVMTFIIFTQDYMGLKDSIAAMQQIGIPVNMFLLVRSILLMLTATMAIILDKVMRYKHGHRSKASTSKVDASTPKVDRIDEVKPETLSLPAPKVDGGYKAQIRDLLEEYKASGAKFTNQDIVDRLGCKMSTVKAYGPGLKKELGID